MSAGCPSGGGRAETDLSVPGPCGGPSQAPGLPVGRPDDLTMPFHQRRVKRAVAPGVAYVSAEEHTTKPHSRSPKGPREPPRNRARPVGGSSDAARALQMGDFHLERSARLEEW